MRKLLGESTPKPIRPSGNKAEAMIRQEAKLLAEAEAASRRYKAYRNARLTGMADGKQ